MGTYCFALVQDRSRSLQLRPWACVLVRESQVGAPRGGVALLPACPVDLRCAGVRVVEYPGKVACPSGRRCSTRNAVWCHSHPGFKSQRYRHCRPAPMGPGGFVMPEWFPSNVARNSRACILGFEIQSLELQRLWAVSKNDRVKLRATFGGVVTDVTFGHLCQARPFTGPAPSQAQPLCTSRDAGEAEPRRVPPLLRVCSCGGRATSARASSRRTLSSSTSP